MRRRFLSITLMFCMISAIFPAFPAFSESWNGGGTEDSPYSISTIDELQTLAANVNNGTNYSGVYFKLTENITLNENVLNKDGSLNITDKDSFTAWIPIGTERNPFGGIFEGDGHTVSGLYVDEDNADNVGFFGYSNGTIKNIGLADSYFDGNRNVGGVCGYNGGIIENCYNMGMIFGSYNTGGVCGHNGGTITDCHNTGSISIGEYIGGVCGENYGTIINCYNTGTVTGSYYMGGVCGGSTGAVTNCYNTGAVTGSYYTGGICGHNSGSGTITNCHNTGAVIGNPYGGGVCGYNSGGTIASCYTVGAVSGDKIGGVCGFNRNGTITSCYYDNTIYTAVDNTSGVTGIATAQFESLENFEGFDSNEWKVAPLLKRPVLISNTEGGTGTEKDPYIIPNFTILCTLADLVNSGTTYEGEFIKLTSDITMNKNVLNADGTLNGDGSGFVSWTPIGTDINPFCGNFDGDNHTVSGLYFDNSGKSYIGLFGYLENGGIIQNVGVIDSYIHGDYAGGVCGGNSGTVKNCYNSGYITGSANVGGVCGYNSNPNSILTCCYNTGTVKGGANAGGVCGTSDGSVTNSYNIGAVAGDDCIGGVCGNNRGEVANSYSAGEVEGDTNAGGLCGISGIKKITNSYYLGVSAGAGADEGISKTAVEFASGEVTWLLQNGQTPQVWGQTLSGAADAMPVLTNNAVKRVYKAAFMWKNVSADYKEYDAKYANRGGKVELPTQPIVQEGYVFDKWATSADADAFTSDTPVTADITLNAYRQEKYGETEDAKTVTTTYGTGTTKDLSTCIDYAGDTAEANKFTYTITSGNNNNYFSISGDTLTVSDTTPVNTYTLNITASEKSPQISLFSIDYGISDVEFAVTVTVNKATVAAPDINSKVYNGSNQTADITETDRYTITVNNGGTNVGAYDVVLTLTDSSNYKWTDSENAAKTLKFNITQAVNEWTVEPSVANVTYGTDIEPQGAAKFGDVKITYIGVDDTRYDTSTAKPTAAGSYKAEFSVEGTANYTPISQNMNFTITKANSQTVVDGAAVTYGEQLTLKADVTKLPSAQTMSLFSVDADEVEFIVTEGGQEILLGTAAVVYNNNSKKDSGTATLTVIADKKLGIGNNKIKAVYGGSVNLNDSEKDNIAVTMKARPLEYTVAAADRVYDNTNTVDVTLTPINAVRGDNITLTAKGNVLSVNKGEYREVDLTDISINGNDAGYYSADTSKANVRLGSTVTISAKSISGAIVDSIADKVYTGSAIEPAVTVRDGETTLIKGIDYTILYSNNIHVGTAIVTVTGMGNYAGEKKAEFSIIADAADYIAPAAKAGLVYTGVPQELITGGSSIYGTMKYSLTENGTYSTEIPKGTDAGEYIVYYKVFGDSNHIDTVQQSISAVISKAIPDNIEKPVNLTAICGQTLSDIKLPDGWVWKNSTQDVGNEGINKFAAVFTPSDIKNYTTVETELSVMVKQIMPTLTLAPTLTPTAVPTLLPTTKPHYGSGSSIWPMPKPTSTPTLTVKPTDIPINNPFVDVSENDWFYKNVIYNFSNGLMFGITDTEFAPDDDITRAMFIAVLYRLEGEPKNSLKCTFIDVPQNEYYASAVAWANEHKIVEGYSPQIYSPKRIITREQMAAIIYRYAKYKGYDTNVNGALSYSDRDIISDYARDAVIWNSANGIMFGNDDNAFAPHSNTTRAQAAAVFERVAEKLK